MAILTKFRQLINDPSFAKALFPSNHLPIGFSPVLKQTHQMCKKSYYGVVILSGLMTIKGNDSSNPDDPAESMWLPNKNLE